MEKLGSVYVTVLHSSTSNAKINIVLGMAPFKKESKNFDFSLYNMTSPNCTFLDFRALCMAIEQTGGCLFQRKLTQNMDISICKNSIKERQVARVEVCSEKKITQS